MRAWTVNGIGEPADVLSLDENAADFDPGRHQLKIRVEVAGLGLPDVFMCHNTYPLTPPIPFIPSQEAVGEVIAVGNGKVLDSGEIRGLDLKAGDKVLFGKYSGTEVKVDGEELLVMKEDDVMAVIEG